ncbi:MAG: enolase C-terminal domain-like protein [Pigmentiphaga sp.]|uniref:mandelate racemase/muconate lactonizing enzyme family protein n=1 Tax=Pigmentiphaga sp. TaxID=1977564 RepID=UPI0029B008F6|nr:enolase C-terminal domain-like protein [Pigmentiphaga sp.]MDX3908117.1 enolase C-terminal domain-like protein [Pigmentiphaga sp.]
MTDIAHPAGTARAAAPATIDRVEIVPCSQRQDDPSWRFARGTITHVDGWLVKLVARNGQTGYGHVLGTPIFQPDTARIEPVLEALRQVVAGSDAFGLEAMHRRLEAAAAGEMCVLSGFVCAVYDLQARLLGVPLHVLLGGKVRDSVDASRLVSIKSPEEMASHADKLAKQGYRFLKLKLSGEPGLDIERVRTVRERVGESLVLTVDANQAYGPDDAIRVCRELRPFGVAMMEQPVPAADVEGLCRVHAAGELPIEADEAIGDLAGLVRLIGMGAADSYNLKLHYLGGIRNTLIAVRLCEAAGVGYRFGAIFGPRLLAAQGVHVASVARNIHAGAELAEFDHLLDDPFEGLEVRDGALAVSAEAGSGVTYRPSARAEN